MERRVHEHAVDIQPRVLKAPAPHGEGAVEIIARGDTGQRLHRPKRIVGDHATEIAQLDVLQRMCERLAGIGVEDGGPHFHEFAVGHRILREMEVHLVRRVGERPSHPPVADRGDRQLCRFA